MGKLEDQRAMREANHLARSTGVKAARPAIPKVPTKGGPKKETQSGPLCGHRSVGGKSCTRVKDHDEKSHRYAKVEK